MKTAPALKAAPALKTATAACACTALTLLCAHAGHCLPVAHVRLNPQPLPPFHGLAMVFSHLLRAVFGR